MAKIEEVLLDNNYRNRKPKKEEEKSLANTNLFRDLIEDPELYEQLKFVLIYLIIFAIIMFGVVYITDLCDSYAAIKQNNKVNEENQKLIEFVRNNNKNVANILNKLPSTLNGQITNKSLNTVLKTIKYNDDDAVIAVLLRQILKSNKHAVQNIDQLKQLTH